MRYAVCGTGYAGLSDRPHTGGPRGFASLRIIISAARLVVLSALICFPSLCRAQFTLAAGYPSGGAVTSGSGGYSSSGATRTGSAGGVPASIGGTLTWEWNWTGSGPAPSYVILKVDASATWTGPGGTCSDGMGDPTQLVGPPPPAPPNSGTSSGTHYLLQAVSGSTFTYTVNPSPSISSGSVGVSVTVVPTPIYISLSGPSNTGSEYNIDVGQRLTAVLNGTGTPGDTYTWSTPTAGNPLAGYTASASSASVSLFSPPPTTSSSLSCYFGSSGSPVIQCNYYSALLGQTVTITANLNVLGPARVEFYEGCGTMMLMTGTFPILAPYSGSGSPASFNLWGATYGTTTAGMWQVDKIADPSCVTLGSGSWGYIQTRNATFTVNGTPVHFTGLDGTFPMMDALTGSTNWSAAVNSSHRGYNDTPGRFGSLSPFPFSLDCNLSYNLYIFYQPPVDAAGSSIWVPMRFIPWSALGQCSSSSSSGPWAQTDSGSGFGSALDYIPPASWPVW